MYAFAPVSLYALRQRDPDRPRPYRLPAYRVLAPAGFVSANLIIYWSTFEATWKLCLAGLVGLAVFAVNRLRLPSEDRVPLDPMAAAWVWPWLLGLVVIGYFGRYGGNNTIPNWWDLITVVVFAVVVYEVAEKVAISREEVNRFIDAERDDIAAAQEINLIA
jgi:amino acid transporter